MRIHAKSKGKYNISKPISLYSLDGCCERLRVRDISIVSYGWRGYIQIPKGKYNISKPISLYTMDGCCERLRVRRCSIVSNGWRGYIQIPEKIQYIQADIVISYGCVI